LQVQLLVTLLYLPAGQLVQLAEVEPEYFPVGQFVQDFEPEDEYFPQGQLEQLFCDVYG